MTTSLPRHEVAHLLQTVDTEVRVIRDVERRIAALTAPKFSFFDFLRTDEMGLSRCIAALLNPRGAHGQGSAYLELFMDALGCDVHWCDELASAAVDTEMPANGGRRYDIEVRLQGQRAIVIENKPWAADQALQLSDYARELNGTCCPAGWKLVYLSQGAPSEQSISKEDLARYQEDRSLEVMQFHQLAVWLGLCAQRTKPMTVRLFIEQLEQFIRKTLCGEAGMSESESIKDVVMGSQQNLRAALLVGSTLDAVKRRLLVEGLKEPLSRALGAQFFWDDAILEKRRDAGFGTRPHADAPGYLEYMFEFGGWSGFFWGIRRGQVLGGDVVEHEQADALRTFLRSEYGQGGQSPHWFWYSVDLRRLSRPGLPAVPKNWQFEEAPWLAMQSRNLHDGFVEHANQVAELVAQTSARAILEGPC